jgi:hypothetical protein
MPCRQAEKDRGQSRRVEHHDDGDEGVDEKIDAHGGLQSLAKRSFDEAYDTVWATETPKPDRNGGESGFVRSIGLMKIGDGVAFGYKTHNDSCGAAISITP